MTAIVAILDAIVAAIINAAIDTITDAWDEADK
jgi:hypothetical protein